jgi:NADPH-dependent 2,4-dienoyl-CoA reductase/sulfur reductase-like enzyme
MKTYYYSIIGGGMAGSASAMEIRKHDPNGSIAMFSKENFMPYNRPPLTKGLWDGEDVEDIMRPMQDYNVDFFLNTAVSGIDPAKKILMDENGEKYKFDKLLLATGGYPIHLPDVPESMIYYRTRADYHKLHELTASKDTFCVIGGGFIGSEIAAALNKNGKQVTMIFPETGISGLRFPDDLANFLNDYYRGKGVNIFEGHLVESISKQDNRYQVKFKQVDQGTTKQEIFDIVIVGIGIKPNVSLAESAGLDVDDGIVVNEYLQTSHPDIFAAGDVAYFLNKGLNKRMRVEHEDNANKMGAVAGRNMAGEMIEYDNFPFFYSDLFDLGYEAVGEMNKDLDIFEDWIDEFKKGTIYYLDQRKIRGLIFWNLWGQVDKGRQVISNGESYQESDLTGLFSED